MGDPRMTPNNDQSQQGLAQQRTGWAYERTQMAAIRTYFALLRTGLAIAGGGALVTSILARGWPDWVIWSLASVFVVVGFGIMILGLRNYHHITRQLAIEDETTAVSIGWLVALTVILLLATVAALILFLLS